MTTPDTLSERLRTDAAYLRTRVAATLITISNDCADGADALDAAHATIAGLREALKQVAAHPIENVTAGRPDLGIPAIPSCQSIARAALNGVKSP